MKLPQLSLRELFLLVVIAAMGCGWWVDHQRLRRLWRRDEWRMDIFWYVLERGGYKVNQEENAEAGIVIIDPSGQRVP